MGYHLLDALSRVYEACRINENNSYGEYLEDGTLSNNLRLEKIASMAIR